MSTAFSVFEFWTTTYTLTVAAVTATLISTIHIFVSTPHRIRWTQSFNLAFLLLTSTLAVFICFLLSIYYTSPHAYDPNKQNANALQYALAVTSNLQFLVAEICLTWMVHRIYPRKKFLIILVFIVLCILLRFAAQFGLSMLLIIGRSPWLLSAVNQILIMFNCAVFSGLFIFRYRHKLHRSHTPNQFYRTMLNLSIRNAIIPTIIIIPIVVTHFLAHIPSVLVVNGILNIIFRLTLGLIIADSLYRLNRGDSSNSPGRRIIDPAMSERLNSIHLSTLNLTTSFGVERKIDKIFENYLLEVHAIVGGTKGYYVERTRHGQMNVRCGFSFHEADDDTRVSIYPVDDPAQQAEIPCAALQYGLERMQLSIIHFDVDRLDEELRIYLGDRVNRLSSALFLPITMGASAKQRILYIETEEPDDSQLDRSIDIQALTFLTQQLVANVDSAKLFSKLVNLNQSLEKKVMERTTELQKRNLELEQAKCEALQAASAKAVFLSNMSHEIRTPISQVILATELLSTLELPSDGLEYLNIIIHSGKLLLSLVNDILDLSKLETGNVILESIEFDLHELIQITMDAFTVESDVKLGYFLEKDVPRVVVGDVTRLRQILTNLVSNAIKFTRSGYVLLFVCSDQVNENEFDVQFNVIDTGSGIAPHNLDRIFNRYAQEDASIARKFGGTGLGLPICQDLCKLMGSSLSVKSVVGSGSKFSFSIRFSRSESVVERSRFSHIFDDAVKVLILENPTYWYQSRSILCYQIEAMGAEVQSSPLYLHPNIDCSLYDILIVDLTTTQIEGVRLTDLIRSCDVPVILVHSASQLGVINHIYNDIGSESFRTTVHKLLHPYKQSSLFKLVSSFTRTRPLAATIDEFNGDSAATLPALAESQASTEKLKNNVASLQPEPKLVSILLVEDNSINQKIMNTMITKLGYNADIASDGQTAVELAEAKHYDLILMDVCIPVLDGLEATKQIRELYRDREIGSGDEKLAPDPYIVGLSANVSPEHEIEGLHAGMNVYLAKPILRSTLSEIINNL